MKILKFKNVILFVGLATGLGIVSSSYAMDKISCSNYNKRCLSGEAGACEVYIKDCM